jgi:hypothetical protein
MTRGTISIGYIYLKIFVILWNYTPKYWWVYEIGTVFGGFVTIRLKYWWVCEIYSSYFKKNSSVHFRPPIKVISVRELNQGTLSADRATVS